MECKNIFRGGATVAQLAVARPPLSWCYIINAMKEKRTYADRREYLIRAVSNRRRKLKAMAIEYKGGECQICGYSKHQVALDFHHIDPSEKDFAMGHKGYTRSWEKIKEELDKCILLCATCHREVEAGVTQLPEGIQDCKRGELLEALTFNVGNQQPSPERN